MMLANAKCIKVEQIVKSSSNTCSRTGQFLILIPHACVHLPRLARKLRMEYSGVIQQKVTAKKETNEVASKPDTLKW